MEFDWEAFKKEKIAVYCKDEEKEDFLNQCEKHNLNWQLEIRANVLIPTGNFIAYSLPIKEKFKFLRLKGLSCEREELLKENGWKIINWSDYMKKEFTKADLKPFMLVVCRNGEKHIVSEEYLIDEYKEFLCISDFDKNLSHRNFEEFDIISVHIPKEERLGLSFDLEDRICIWERKEVKEMTVAEISEALGYDVKIVKEKE